MRRDVAMAGLGFWLLMSALVALMAGKVRAETRPLTPAVAPAIAPTTALAGGQFHGQVVFSDVLIASPAQFPSEAAMTEALRRLKRTTVEGADGFWRLHLVAFLDPAPQSASFRLRATDVTDPHDRREVKVFEVDGQPGQKELGINDLVVTETMGFARGHRYEITVVPRADEPVAGKEDVYAKGVITLM
jgi:hypothetical protein